MLTKKIYFSFFTVLLLFSCAKKYHPLHPESLNYGATSTNDGIVMQYKYDVLGARGNERYSKKESDANIAVVALKIQNTTSQPLKVGENVKLFLGEEEVYFLEPEVAAQKIKQKAGLYALYLLMLPINGYVDNGKERKTFPVGLILGPGLAIGNIAVASGANTNLKSELKRYQLQNKVIEPGETAYALATLPNRTFGPLSLRFMDKITDQ